LHWLKPGARQVIDLDKLTYADNPNNFCDRQLVTNLLSTDNPIAVVHFAAESHMDRSIQSPLDFVKQTPRAPLTYWKAADSWTRESAPFFRFVHIATDEVFGSLPSLEPTFSEQRRYAPSSPYPASKAAADHLERAWWTTCGLPIITLNRSDNYGPFQSPEKHIPLMTIRTLEGQTLPIYGDGGNVRDWLFAGDFCRAIELVLRDAAPGDAAPGTYYNVGGQSEKTTPR
jgi:dTDP-glucose 4,6-dehydratase